MRNEELYLFTVVGSGEFPIDMLRYDGCWPYEREDAAKIEASFREPGLPGVRTVVLQTTNRHGPTYRRWESFTWRASLGEDRQAAHRPVPVTSPVGWRPC